MVSSTNGGGGGVCKSDRHTGACVRGVPPGHWKYIFRAYFDDEQLFNLDSDPHEYHDLAGNPAYQAELLTWRARLVQQFESEHRGPSWVRNGTLQRRVKGQLYSPNYPGDPGDRALVFQYAVDPLDVV